MPRVRKCGHNFNKPTAYCNAFIVLAVQTTDMHSCLDSYDQTTAMQMALTR